MGLFAPGQEVDRIGIADAPQRMAWTRELGTRRLILAFLVIVGGYFLISKIWDHFLLQKQWPALPSQAEGLTLVGTLDARGNYEQNLFRIVQTNETSHIELTEFGWRSIFDDKNGPLFADTIGERIKGVIDVDNDTGFAMLQPYLKAETEKGLGNPAWKSIVTRDYPIQITERHGKEETVRKTTLGALLDKYSGESPAAAKGEDAP